MPRPPTTINTGVLRGRPLDTYYARSVAGSTDVTLTEDEVSAGILEFTGALTAAINVIFPVASAEAGEPWKVTNSTTGPSNFSLTVKATGQTGVIIERGVTESILCDGTDLKKSQPLKIPRRFELKWVAGQHRKPGVVGDVSSATPGIMALADPEFMIVGTNATSALCTQHAEGGLLLTTAGGSADQEIVAPHSLTSASAWTGTTWGTDDVTEWEGYIATGAAITSLTIWAGLKLTNTSVTATDDDQVFFRYAAATNSGKWQAIYSIGGTDTAVDTGITAVLGTRYHCRITINSARVAKMYLNDLLVATSTALTDTTDLIPYIGVQADTAAAKTCRVLGQSISRIFG